MNIARLTDTYPLLSDQVSKQEIYVILRELDKVLSNRTDGNIVEFGCYTGTTSLFIKRLMDLHRSQSAFHVYDSFAGLPAKTAPDLSPAGEQFKPGELTASKSDFILNFKKAGLKPPIIHKSWFDRLKPSDVPDNICFAFLDGDYYESIHTSLKLIWDKLSPGAAVIIDDYQSEALPGVKKAADRWLAGRSVSIKIEASLAIIYP